jgi:hypothetical protein
MRNFVIGKKIDERLAALGGKRIVDRVDCDLIAEPAGRWIGDAGRCWRLNAGGRVIEVDFGAARPALNTDVVEAESSTSTSTPRGRTKRPSISRSASKVVRPPTSRATHLTSIQKTIRPMWTTCSRPPAFPGTKSCAQSSSSHAM